jgi:hypothetical protein
MNEDDILELKKNWAKLKYSLSDQFGEEMELQAILFIIGVQELGQGRKKFTREQKQDLIHIATCRLLSTEGYYEFEGTDHEGWPRWKLLKPIPHMTLKEQDILLRKAIINYFERSGFLKHAK